MFYEVSVNSDGFGAGRSSRKPRENPKRGHLVDAFRCAAGSGNTVFYSVSVPSDRQNLLFFEGVARKHRLERGLRRVGRPGARPPEKIDGRGARGANKS